ncbi:MAG: ornithine carbamoyltransferase [Candidatus Raymondbacteria bacterium RifOxyA12_full_50_37]|uniref:Ornithine carbamoyltransferase n=1 Tax=Candidatus Raymondbacteria bacterium RIFOXYD12_FULL_49_13 TaxID=1817890 RepID=A0A1F7F090_UNCRA|nr:MAG: ornithine carbamoyltransferase [Candidatus Raymondbacteria bacterium RifOxyB12_full_50_8]OGJ87211.1 MAG: ornithine carbamoyltransferase [Candidatus Raymondbacteria bacterium RifOxyA12_full_50_37]OGJ88782.1 MAG: ornithine carbamoyltransferase [Candidatus Raymondbacteria bacterium RIFOXYA2_FULL_49_16]OGJ96541.1 MAG: ornithine carbamoyltransferase [Candidatus Raymondbacteria bacterium RIFOXYC2_FULL_50_21]OGJ99170.1 MAG: ornithine carbamoyltransferase [Candidatus Raymondbacteria bacterium R
MNKDLLSLFDLSEKDILKTLSLAAQIKKELKQGKKTRQALAGKVIALIFEKPSLRTRVTFETGVVQLGGHPIYLDNQSIGLGKRESTADIARNLERWVNGIVIRTFAQKTVEDMASAVSIPVINALSDTFHPCQALATGLTIQEHLKKFKGITVAFVGDGNNVAASLFILCAKLGMHAVLACPKGYELDKKVEQEVLRSAKQSGASLKTTNDPVRAVKDADLIYTDVWASMGQEEEIKQRKQDFAGFQVNSALVSKAKKGCLVSHCLPAHREEEITSEVLDSVSSVTLDEAENRLHVQKAVLSLLFQ